MAVRVVVNLKNLNLKTARLQKVKNTLWWRPLSFLDLGNVIPGSVRLGIITLLLHLFPYGIIISRPFTWIDSHRFSGYCAICS